MSAILAVGCGIAIHNAASTLNILLINYKRFKSRMYLLSWITLIFITISLFSSIIYLQTNKYLLQLQILLKISNYSASLALLPLLLTRVFKSQNLTTPMGKLLTGIIPLTISANTLFMVSLTTCALSSTKSGLELDRCAYYATVRVTFIMKTIFELILYCMSIGALIYILGNEILETDWIFNMFINQKGSIYVITSVLYVALSIVSLSSTSPLSYSNLETIFTMTSISNSFILYFSVSQMYCLDKSTTLAVNAQPRATIRSVPILNTPTRREKVDDDVKSDLRFKGSVPGSTIEAMANVKLGRPMDDRRSVISRNKAQY